MHSEGVAVCYCNLRCANQKGGCERSHSEIRKLLSKCRDIRFDLLTRGDAPSS